MTDLQINDVLRPVSPPRVLEGVYSDEQHVRILDVIRQVLGEHAGSPQARAEKAKGLDDPAYKKARAVSFRAAGPNGIDRLLKQNNVVALIGPTMPPAWKIDAVNGDQISGGGAGSLAAVAGYPHLTVPMGLVKGLPVGLSFIGPKWSEALLLSFGYAYEQARGPFPKPQFLRSIEDSPQIAPLLEPAPR